MTQNEAVRYWLKSAQQNMRVAEDNFRLKHYYKLAKLAQVPVNDEKEAILKEITSFNIEARYDDYKFNFYKKATLSYTQKWINNCREIYRWLRKFI